MFVVVISKFRHRTWLVFRILIMLLLLALILPRINAITTKDITSSWFKEQKPSGNPMRVQHNHQPEILKVKESPVEQFKETLKNYYNLK